MPDPCLILAAAVCLSRPAHVETVSNSLWGGARIEFEGVTITSIVRSDSGVFPDRRSMPRYCSAGSCIYYHVYCSSQDAGYFCRVSYNEPGEAFSRRLEIAAPDATRMASVFGQVKIRGFRSGHLFPLANFQSRSSNPYPPYCRAGTDRGCGEGRDDVIAAASPRQVYSNITSYDGARISLRGYITNGRCLFQSKRRYDEFTSRMHRNRDDFEPADYDSDAITIVGPPELPQYGQALSRRNATVRGTLIGNYLNGRVLDLHACGRAAIVVDRNDFRDLVAALTRNGATGEPNPERAADRLPPPDPSSDDEDRIPTNPVSPRRNPNPPNDQAAQPQVEQLGLQIAATPPR